jgi:2-keto-4-pentenoate hydratase/2-oxohepta-3-ene-1,7-dioic acid hydratase in catechol pathway
MKLARFEGRDGRPRIGKVLEGIVIDVSDQCTQTECIGQLLAAQPELFSQLDAVTITDENSHSLEDVRLLAPLTSPSKFLAIGMNYRDHAEEALRIGIPEPKSQLWFNKQVSCIAGPNDDIDLPPTVTQLDYEAELGIVIGRKGRYIPREEALSYVAGFLVVNDVSARDWQQRSPTWTLGKSFDTHGPIGPWLVTPDDVPDPQNLDICLRVNGEIRQRASTSQMIHDIANQIAYLSEVMTLVPGDLIATGTPAGVGLAMTPPVFLDDGDVVSIDIEHIGTLSNTVRKSAGRNSHE